MSSGEQNSGSLPRENTPHLPVMLEEVFEALNPVLEGAIVDGTFGAGGYSRALLDEGARVIGIDQDVEVAPYAEILSKEFGEKFIFVPGKFSTLDTLANGVFEGAVDGVVMDIGVSSMQLDEAERGFSFMRDGPLDMRMGPEGMSAADLINSASEREISDLIFAFGEEKRARRIAKAIVAARKEKPITGTLQLAQIIEETVGRKPGSTHPATKSFQALRIAVNREMDELVAGLFAAERLLRAGGWLAVVTFHSLEDRIVKRFFDAQKSAGTVSRHMPLAQIGPSSWQKIAKPRKASTSETAVNPRARSATLRAAQRTQQKARDFSIAGLGVPGSNLMGAL